LKDYIDEYAFVTKAARTRNATIWTNPNVKDVEILKVWIDKRVSYLNGYINGL
jgi:hypothetical protein